MIIRHLSIQSHDNLGAAVFKLMINSACCIQTQLIVFMPHADAIAQKYYLLGTVYMNLTKCVIESVHSNHKYNKCIS